MAKWPTAGTQCPPPASIREHPRARDRGLEEAPGRGGAGPARLQVSLVGRDPAGRGPATVSSDRVVVSGLGARVEPRPLDGPHRGLAERVVDGRAIPRIEQGPQEGGQSEDDKAQGSHHDQLLRHNRGWPGQGREVDVQHKLVNILRRIKPRRPIRVPT